MKHEFKPDYAVAPGKTLLEWMDVTGCPHLETAGYLKMSGEDLVNLITGVMRIDATLADKLQYLTGIATQMWLSLESGYRKKQTEIEEREAKRREIVVGVNLGLLEDLMEGASVGAQHGGSYGQEWVNELVAAIDFAKKTIDKIEQSQVN